MDNESNIVGTNFKPDSAKKGNEELKSWLLRLLSPKIEFHFYTLKIEENTVVLLEVEAAFKWWRSFYSIGSYKLKDYPEKERELWRVFEKIPFEKEIAAENMSAEDVLHLLNYPEYFRLMNQPLPADRTGILKKLKADDMIVASRSENWDITNLGAVLFARKLSDFSHLKRKVVRVIQYKGVFKYETIVEEVSEQGYAVGYDSLIKTIMQLIPSHEKIEGAFRKKVSMLPELAIRELVANMIIHQDFHSKGTSVMVELFDDRIEMTNPGASLVETERWLDMPPKSRNELLASFMRRINICEERGSGIDKVLKAAEFGLLPAPIFRVVGDHTLVVLFAYKALKDIEKSERIRACYMHATLMYVQHSPMTNATLRERFSVDSKNSAVVSRIIADTIDAKFIRCQDNSVGKKARKYVPFWA